MVEGRTVTAGIMLAIFILMVGLALTYPAESRILPLVIGIPGVILSGIQFVTELRTKDGPQTTTAERRAEVRMVGWFVFFVVGIILFGFPYAGPLMVAIYLRLSWREKWYVTLAAAVFAWAILYGVFEEVLGLPLFEGLVVQYFSG
jgi:hypothetical protein